MTETLSVKFSHEIFGAKTAVHWIILGLYTGKRKIKSEFMWEVNFNVFYDLSSKPNAERSRP